MKAIGGNARDLKVVAFKGSAEAITKLLGGHIDLGHDGAAGNVAAQVAAGASCASSAVAAERRFPRHARDLPTWKEQGVNLVFGGSRGILAPKGLTPQQSAYLGRRRAQSNRRTAEWKQDLEKNFWADDFSAGERFRKDLDQGLRGT